MPQLIVIAHDIRSTHNVGSLLRTAEGLGVTCVYFTGYTPYPSLENDPRLPHEAARIHRQISKTALGAETTQHWERHGDILALLGELKADGYLIAALEQSPDSRLLPKYVCPDKLALLLGREVEGIEPELLSYCDVTLEIPMAGRKESFNVVQAAAMALYQFTFGLHV